MTESLPPCPPPAVPHHPRIHTDELFRYMMHIPKGRRPPQNTRTAYSPTVDKVSAPSQNNIKGKKIYYWRIPTHLEPTREQQTAGSSSLMMSMGVEASRTESVPGREITHQPGVVVCCWLGWLVGSLLFFVLGDGGPPLTTDPATHHHHARTDGRRAGGPPLSTL